MRRNKRRSKSRTLGDEITKGEKTIELMNITRLSRAEEWKRRARLLQLYEQLTQTKIGNLVSIVS